MNNWHIPGMCEGIKMYFFNQKGIAHIVALLILLVGIVAGLYLVRHPQIFKPRAGGPSSQLMFKIKPYILIPIDWKDKVSVEDIEQDRISIANALKAIQSWYGQKLDGHTFNIDETEIKVVYSQIPLNYQKQTIDTNNTASLFYKINGSQLIPSEDATVNVIWLIGSENLDATAQSVTDNMGIVVINHSALSDYTGVKGESAKNLALGTLAHELGHTFGLKHPCSLLSAGDCPPDATQPLPGPEESYNSIMKGPAYGFPNLGFNNSSHNPEVWIIYRSQFINPNNDSPPAGTIAPSINKKTPSVECIASAGATLYLPIDSDISYYQIRINNKTDGWDGSCRSYETDDFCFDNLSGSNPVFSFPVRHNQDYELWYHKLYKDGAVSKASEKISFNCKGNMVPTPTLPKPVIKNPQNLKGGCNKGNLSFSWDQVGDEHTKYFVRGLKTNDTNYLPDIKWTDGKSVLDIVSNGSGEDVICTGSRCAYETSGLVGNYKLWVAAGDDKPLSENSYYPDKGLLICRGEPKKIAIEAVCSGNTATISWSGITASNYAIRADGPISYPNNDCGPHPLCVNKYTSNSVNVSVKTGNVRFWFHTLENNVLSPLLAEKTFSCP